MLLRLEGLSSWTKSSKDVEVLETVRRSLESIKLEISLGTPVDSALVEDLEIQLTRLERHSNPLLSPK